MSLTLEIRPWTQPDSQPLRSNDFGYSFDYLQGESTTILNVAAVSIRPYVAHILDKLVYKVSVRSYTIQNGLHN